MAGGNAQGEHSRERRAAAVAHELKNPLEAMTDLVYLLQQNPSLNEDAHQRVKQLTDELERMGHIVNQRLGLYRGSASRRIVSLRKVLDTILAFYARKIQFKQIKVDKRYTCDGLVQALPEEMRQVFTNLVVNGLEALPLGGGGRLVIHIFRSRDWIKPERMGVRVVIADNGSGIRPEHRQPIFQSQFTTKGEKGTGLGLWVSAGIIRKLGGSIRVRSCTEPGRNGTAFSVFLPANVLARPMPLRAVRSSRLRLAA